MHVPCDTGMIGALRLSCFLYLLSLASLTISLVLITSSLALGEILSISALIPLASVWLVSTILYLMSGSRSSCQLCQAPL